MFEIQPLSIPDVLLITSKVYDDNRGFFTETFRKDVLKDLPEFVQENCSCSNSGVVRGLHYQINPMPQAKLVQCVSGSIWDVAVDIRRSSPTYGKYVSVPLYSPNKLLYIPEGFAHGFKCLIDKSVVLYKVSNYYSPYHERSIAWNDPTININWGPGKANVSGKDSVAPILNFESDVFL